MIIADDLGYSDLGCFGGEIETPVIDSLAANGLLFTQFKTGAMCAPSRAMLLSGQDHHLAGWGRQSDSPGTIYEGKWGYENEFSPRVLSFPKLLQEAGYFTCIAGKWHVGKTTRSNAAQQGFDRSWVMLDGAANHYNHTGLGLGGYEKEIAEYTEGGQAVDWPNGTFSTTHYTNQLIKYLDQKEDGKPFFALAAYTSPHWPLQPPPEYRDKYKGIYDNGYDDLRQYRFLNLQQKGIISDSIQLPPVLKHIASWESLSPDAQKREARKMELYAGMVDHLDDEIGRLLAHLNAKGELNNTVVIFFSDNGADYLDFYNHPAGNFIRSVYDNSYDNMGSPTSFVSYGPAWAQAAMAPYSWYKGYLAEGGISSPMVISGTGIKKQTDPIQQFLDIRDIAPTILEMAGITNPSSQYVSRGFQALTGSSFVSLLKGDKLDVHDEKEYFVSDFQGKAVVRKGSWKLLNQENPMDDSAFKLYNLQDDPGEQEDLSKKYPAIRVELLGEWRKYQESMRIVYEP